MSLLRSARFPAVMLLSAAVLGLIVANSPIGPAVDAAKHTYLGIPGVFEMSLGHWVQDGLLAVFFFIVAVELQFELTAGELNSARKALQPAIAAAGGVVTPIAVFLLVAGSSDASRGWPIPTATDIAFALGVLAVFGRGLPSGIRIFLLALAILDDIVGIVFIAVLFTSDLNLGLLALAALTVVIFGVLSRRMDTPARPLLIGVLVALGILTWVLTYLSGVHATLAGVALGLAMAQQPALRARHSLEPWVNGLILPLFAFSAALVVIPQVTPTQLSPAFWGILLALPVGKMIGISVAGWLSLRIGNRGVAPHLSFADLLAAGALGGIGFTVSLLLSELAFADEPLLRDEATLGVLGGSMISLVLAGVLVSLRARHHRRQAIEVPR
ncbi:Na+/H+ antiporter NhaA [Microbacterium aurantiacum]|uniref:Na(+)/H(+) antiporter NhaA n=1 Tax=Microbacterium aurantiacum TaxID=162393 RepID=A0A0M8MEP4_9MICO|nr:Na+/H+ antiporter NhaA [Microbacterium chocolatum]KOS09938.1 sodium:proton antiporter [Microbacterium chocolatum]MBN9202444.1 Na+/H+ antiporter NhaA [Microbacterium chocolatum]ODT10115.1 MAG: sodium:proton antiporter [Microbacterium sp. SCN 70-18]